jgi:Penicillin binding protein transpeptidase domain/Penicillin-binding Protein dimerisation domain/NTF2-like N-terminal transpeptidase domain
MFYPSSTEEHAARLRRARPVVALALVAFAIGAIVGAHHTASAEESLAARFVRAWTQRDYARMYLDLDASSQRSISAAEFAAAYQAALRTATATSLQLAGKPGRVRGGTIAVPVRVDTRLFGTLSLSFELKPAAEGGERAALAWSRSDLFPGLRPGELLHRHTELPPRATLLARDGSVLAEGAAAGEGTRSSPLGAAASAVLGTLGPPPAARRNALEEHGVPSDAIVGSSGIERALDDRLLGTPGGQLLAGGRVLASSASVAAPPVRTSVAPALQRAAVAALGGQLGGIVVMQPLTGQILAVAGIGLDSVQPPGSTFKMVTVTGVLEAGIANLHSTFPDATFATLDGVKLSNANGEECGGTLEQAFAVSCNSVFAPLGAKLGAARLVATAERFGFNHDPGIPGAAESTLPGPSHIQGELDLGSTAIGQGQVQASALQMAIVAATVADGGRRPQPTFLLGGQAAAGVAAISPQVARSVRHLMVEVVRNGTGTAAAVPGVPVAGKTGTAELKSECSSASASPSSESAEAGGPEASSSGCLGAASEPSNTDAWFAAFAPAQHPRIVVGVLLVKDGAGGATAAPVAREVLEAGLRSGGY